MTNVGITTMEKSGKILLTKEEVSSFLQTGQVPQRVFSQWGLSSSELSEVIQNNYYEEI